MATKIWNDWKYEDGDYIAEYNKPLKRSLFEKVGRKTMLGIGVAVLGIALFALVLI